MAFIDVESAKNIFSRQDFMNQLKKRFWSGCNFANQRKKIYEDLLSQIKLQLAKFTKISLRKNFSLKSS